MKKIRQSRPLSFLVIAGVYVLAAVIGILFYQLELEPYWLRLFFADVISTGVVFAFSVLFDNVSVYDPYWSVQPPVILIALAGGTGLNAFRLLLIIVVTIWSLRLTANWAVNFPNLTGEDWRYKYYRDTLSTPNFLVISAVGLHLVPTIVVYLTTLPAAMIMVTDVPFSGWCIIFLLLALGSVGLEFFADTQMFLFRRRKAAGRARGFCRVGLWQYSRHPNYLGEITFWWFIYLSVLVTVPSKWYLIIGAVANTVLFALVSIPLAEGKLSGRPAYKEYKESTHVLLPIGFGLK